MSQVSLGICILFCDMLCGACVLLILPLVLSLIVSRPWWEVCLYFLGVSYKLGSQKERQPWLSMCICRSQTLTHSLIWLVKSYGWLLTHADLGLQTQVSTLQCVNVSRLSPASSRNCIQLFSISGTLCFKLSNVQLLFAVKDWWPSLTSSLAGALCFLLQHQSVSVVCVDSLLLNLYNNQINQQFIKFIKF